MSLALTLLRSQNWALVRKLLWLERPRFRCVILTSSPCFYYIYVSIDGSHTTQPLLKICLLPQKATTLPTSTDPNESDVHVFLPCVLFYTNYSHFSHAEQLPEARNAPANALPIWRLNYTCYLLPHLTKYNTFFIVTNIQSRNYPWASLGLVRQLCMKQASC